MRKAGITTATLALMVLSASLMVAQEDVKWFDMEKCDMCRPLTEVEGLMENMTWETYPVSHGIISVTTVNKGYEKAYQEAHKKMQANWEKLQAGEQMQLCGMCQAFIAAQDESMTTETVKTMHGEVSLTTSSKPETVAKLHKIAERNAKEMAGMMKKEKAPQE
jgi:hypothetical protein